MASQFIGEGTAVMVSVMWTVCSIFFASAGKKLGILGLNGYRTVMALALLGSSHLILFGTLIPQANREQWSYLALSGVIGLGIGDFGYFGALVNIGPRRGLLLMSMHPIFSTIGGFFILSEVPGKWALLGIVVTLAGVMIVIMEKEEAHHEEKVPPKQKAKGVFFGLVGAAGQGIGLVISKYGMINAADSRASGLDPLPATLIRMLGAIIFIWIFIFALGKGQSVFRKARHKRGMKLAAAGAIFGPFLGVWGSMVAVSYALTGVAATLMSLMPVFIIPVIWKLYGQKTNIRGILGALIAVIGVAILFLL